MRFRSGSHQTPTNRQEWPSVVGLSSSKVSAPKPALRYITRRLLKQSFLPLLRFSFCLSLQFLLTNVACFATFSCLHDNRTQKKVHSVVHRSAQTGSLMGYNIHQMKMIKQVPGIMASTASHSSADFISPTEIWIKYGRIIGCQRSVYFTCVTDAPDWFLTSIFGAHQSSFLQVSWLRLWRRKTDSLSLYFLCISTGSTVRRPCYR